MIVFKINIRIVEDLEILKTMDISDFDDEYKDEYEMDLDYEFMDE